MQKGFDSKPMCNGKYLKTKLKSYGGKTNKYIYGQKMLRAGAKKRGKYRVDVSLTYQ